MIRKSTLGRALALTTAGVLSGGLAGPAFSQEVQTFTQTVEFDPIEIGESRILGGEITRGCPSGTGTLTQVDISISDLSLTTRVLFTNGSQDAGTITINALTHNHLFLGLNTGGSPEFSLGEENITPPNVFPDPPDTFSCTLEPGQNQLDCVPQLPDPALQTTYPNFSETIVSGTDLAFFASGDPVPVRFRAGAQINSQTPGTWASSLETDATGTLTVTYTCETEEPPPPPPPSLSCDFKFIEGTRGPLFIDTPGVLSSNFQFSVSGTQGPIPVNIIDTLGNGMIFVPNSASVPPAVNGNQLEWSTNIQAGAPFAVSYQINTTGLVEGERVCNSVTASAEGFVDASCSVCVVYDEPPRQVPVAGIPGLALLGMLLGGLGGLHILSRRRT